MSEIKASEMVGLLKEGYTIPEIVYAFEVDNRVKLEGEDESQSLIPLNNKR
jgi:hypothetical protein